MNEEAVLGCNPPSPTYTPGAPTPSLSPTFTYTFTITLDPQPNHQFHPHLLRHFDGHRQPHRHRNAGTITGTPTISPTFTESLTPTPTFFSCLTGQSIDINWTGVANMPTAREGLGNCELNGLIYAVGGVGGVGYNYLNTVEAWRPRGQ